MKYKWTATVDAGPNKDVKFNPSYDDNKFVELLDEISKMFGGWLEIHIVLKALEKEGDES